MLGPVNSTSVGGLTAWRIGIIASTMIALMTIFTVVRRTRADEEAGRTELLMAGVVGRSAQLAAALITACGAAVVVGLAVTAAGIAGGTPATGAIALGAAFAGCGWVFAGVAAVTAQLAESARTATAMAGAVVGLSYAVRAVADTVDGLGWLEWLSPQGWVTRVNAYGSNQLAVLGLFLIAFLALVAVAEILLHRRDVGLAMFPARLGPPGNPRLTSAGSLAIRLHRGSLTGWAVGFVAFGAITGGIAASAGDLINSSPQLADIITRMGGAGVLIDTFLAALGAYAGLLAGAYAISAVLRMHGEETAERVSPILATPVGRDPMAQRTPGLRARRGGGAVGTVRTGRRTIARGPDRRSADRPGQGHGRHADPDPAGVDHGRTGDGDLRVVAAAVRDGLGRARPRPHLRAARQAPANCRRRCWTCRRTRTCPRFRPATCAGGRFLSNWRWPRSWCCSASPDSGAVT